MKTFNRSLLALTCALAMAANADAQESDRPVEISVGGGWHSYAGGSAVEGGAVIGGDATYYVTPALGLGIWTDYTFTESDGSRFPPAALSFVDSTTFAIVNQPLDIWQYGAHAKLRLPGRSVIPFVLVGAGAYTVFFDSQQVDANDNTTGFVVRFGAGVDFTVSGRSGFQLSISDSFYPSWKAERLNPVAEEFRNDRFPEINPGPGALEESVHNFRFTAALIVVPGL